MDTGSALAPETRRSTARRTLCTVSRPGQNKNVIPGAQSVATSSAEQIVAGPGIAPLD
jgi:hypothetical protein